MFGDLRAQFQQVARQYEAQTDRFADALNVSLTPASAGSLDHILIDQKNYGPPPENRPPPQRDPLGEYAFLDGYPDDADVLRMSRGAYWSSWTHTARRDTADVYMDYLNPKGRHTDRLHVPYEIALLDSKIGFSEETGFFSVGHEVAILADRTAFTDSATGEYNGNLFNEYLNETQVTRVENTLEWVDTPKGRHQRAGTREVTSEKPRVIKPDEIFEYKAFAFNTPMLGKEANAYADLRSPLVAGAGSEYVFYSHDYEYYSTQMASERFLPNIYATYLTRGALRDQPELGTGFTGRAYIDHTNMAGAFTQELDGNDYFRSWATAWRNENRAYSNGDQPAVRRGRLMQRLSNQFQNVFFDPDEVSSLRDMNRNKTSFPFYTEVQFRAEQESEFVSLLTATGLSNRFLFALLRSNTEREGFRTYENYVEQTEIINATEGVDESGEVQIVEPRREYDTSPGQHRIVPMTQMIRELEESSAAFDDPGWLASVGQQMSTATVLGQRGFESLLGEEGKFERNILDKIFIAKLKQMMKNYFISWDTSFSINSEPVVCHSETVAYRVEKNRVNRDTNERTFVQNFFFLNTPTLEEVELIDTQVAYGEYYEYTIYANRLVFGTKYRYTNPYPKIAEDRALLRREALLRMSSQKEDRAYGVPLEDRVSPLRCSPMSQDDKTHAQEPNMEEVDQFNFCVISEPYAHFIEVPYKTFDPIKIMDRNPALPQMLIVPYRQVTDRVLINLNSGMDDYVDQPISILEEDQDHFDEVRRASGLPPGAPIRFRTDDGLGESGYFEVWRLDRLPERYEDFAEGEVSTVRPSEHSNVNPDSGAVTLFIKPNKKYYVCARVVDVHGNISNPTEVHEIEIVYDDGVMFFRERAIELKPIEPPKTLEKKMKRFVKICPNLAQSVISGKIEDGLMDADTAMEFRDVKLGEAEKSIWGRKFKVRFVSKDTGRKIDLNLDFTRSHTKVYAPDEN